MNADDDALNNYKAELSKLEKCKGIYIDFINSTLANENTQSIKARVKTVGSYRNKLAKYKDGDPSLRKLPTDKIGIRIITYFNEDAVALAAKLFEYFNIDHNNSIDKASVQSYDRFGYVSIHLIVSFKEEELKKSQYSECRGTCAEIQIRTLMQHAWAEIEHDIGYKSKHEIPTQMRRRFARLAGLLEIADSEFTELRREAKSYEVSDLELNQVEGYGSLSISELKLFIMSNSEVINARAEIKNNRAVFYTEHLIDPTGYYAEVLPQIGIYDTDTLEAKLRKYRSEIIGFARSHYPGPGVSVRRPDALPFGYPINILIDLLTGRLKLGANTDKH